MTSNHHAPYDLGYTRATMDGSKGSEAARWSETQKPVLSSDCSLQLDCTKLESLVIANQNVAVNTFSGLVHTARHVTKVGNTRSPWLNLFGGSGRRWDWRLGRSRNKVAVPEGAAGTPPFWSDVSTRSLVLEVMLP